MPDKVCSANPRVSSGPPLATLHRRLHEDAEDSQAPELIMVELDIVPLSVRWLVRPRLQTLLLVVVAAIGASRPASAQTDYYNTDAGRPIRIEDAYATERYAFELQLAPLRLERSRGGVYNWGVEPEIAYGILPR